MRNIALAISYDGTHFAGFQRQSVDRSVQGTLEEALGRLTGETPEQLRLAGAGRTDSGVHASGMVVNFHTAKGLAEDTWVRALNAHLPSDVKVQRAREVDMTFHSRFSAIARSYRYVVLARRTPDPLCRFTSLWEPRRLPELSAMMAVWRELVGTHDFVAFGSTGSSMRSTVCTVTAATCELEGDRLNFEITAQSFLYHMVRRLVGTAIEVAKGKLDACAFRASLSGPASFVSPTAPACGLMFTGATYPPPYAGLFGPF